MLKVAKPCVAVHARDDSAANRQLLQGGMDPLRHLVDDLEVATAAKGWPIGDEQSHIQSGDGTIAASTAGVYTAGGEPGPNADGGEAISGEHCGGLNKAGNVVGFGATLVRLQFTAASQLDEPLFADW